MAAKTPKRSGGRTSRKKSAPKFVLIPTNAPDASAVAQILREISRLLELTGENAFKIRAYDAAADAIKQLGPALHDRVADGTLTDIKGIGDRLASKITELVTTGRLAYYEDLRDRVPPGLREMLRIPGMGAKKALALHEALGIATIGELEYACRENRLVELPGFGPKSQQNILDGIAFLKRFSEYHLIDVALAEAQIVLAALSTCTVASKLAVCGSLRRCREIIRDLDFLAASTSPEQVVEAFITQEAVEHVTQHGATKASVRLRSGMQADLRVVAPKAWPYALVYFTGSKAHNIALRQRAHEHGWKLNEYGLYEDEKLVQVRSESGLYAKLGLAYIPPELREDSGEIEAAADDALPKLVEPGDLRGVFHIHTIASDGAATIQQLADAARDRGWSCLGISDHSASAAYAGGLNADALLAQRDEIDAFNRSSDVRIFAGVESDILEDGRLDYPAKVLARLDFVVASIHSGFRDDVERMTRRIIRAVENPATTMLGHPTGRLLLAREGYALDIEAVLEACAKHDVIVEINAHPQRLDLDWRNVRRARELGVKVAINPDAHSIEGLDDVRYGLGIARKGWCEAADVLNTATPEEVEAIFARKRGASA